MTQITIPSEPITVTYAAVVSTTGPFIVPFTFLKQEDVVAIVTDALLVETLLVLTTDFTFTSLDAPVGQEGIGYTGGEITLVAPIGADGNSSIQILRSTVIDRTANYPTTGPFSMAILNDEQNDHIAIMQELAAGQSNITANTLQFVTDLGNETTNNIRLIRGLTPLDVDFIEIGVSGTLGFLSGGGAVTAFDVLSNIDFRIAGGEFHVLDTVQASGMSIEAVFAGLQVEVGAIGGTTDLNIGVFGARWQNINMDMNAGGFFSVGVVGGNTISIGDETTSILCESPGWFGLRDDIGNNIQARVGTNSIAWTPNSVDDWSWTFEDGMELRFEEKAAALGFFADFGSIWVRDSAPCALMFTNDVGTDFDLTALAGATTGSFTIDFDIGTSDSNVVTIIWQRVGDVMHITMPAANFGNADSNELGTGADWPVGLRPASTRYGSTMITENSAEQVMAAFFLNSAGVLTFTAPNAGDAGDYGNFFSAAGVKGVNGGWSWTYRITDS